MKILVTGAEGFVGKNLVENLKNFRDGKNRTRPNLWVEEIYAYGRKNSEAELNEWCGKADFVFHLAGVNRPKNDVEFQAGNVDFTGRLLAGLKRNGNKAPVMFASSVQASLGGRFGTSPYGLSKRAGEELLFDYGKETGSKVYVYRFPNLAGKWIRPNYNSAIGTFCHNIANDMPININDPHVELELLFIDDLLEEMYDALEGKPHRADYDGLIATPNENGKYCFAPVTHRATLGEIADWLYTFHKQPSNLMMPAIAEGSLAKKLYSMYLSYLPKDKAIVDLVTHDDIRGSFTELIKTSSHGQFSVNISRPGITKGQHWHNSKWEMFIVVAGHGLIQQRKIGTDEVIEFEVSGDKIQAVYMLPGYTHNIINLSKTENLVTVMWANEVFNSNKPDTFFEEV